MSEQYSSSSQEKQSILPERIEFKNSKGLTLVGDLRKADTKAIVIMSHGLTADRHERGLFDLVAPQINKNEHNVLNFDFSGSGESEGDITKPSLWVDDLIDAVRYAKEKGFGPVDLLGMSFGGYVVARAYPEVASNISTIVLWMPVVDKKVNPENHWSQDQQQELATTGKFTIKDEAMVRKVLCVDREFFDVWSTLDPQELLSPIKCKTLIVHGESDDLVLPEGSKKGIQFLPEGSKLELVPGVGHGYKRMGEKGPARFIEITNQWLSGHLSQ